MVTQFEYSTLADAQDVKQLGNVIQQCFLSPSSNLETYINRIGVDNLRCIRCSEQVVGGLATIAMGQWFGSQRVTMTGIAARRFLLRLGSFDQKYSGARATVTVASSF